MKKTAFIALLGLSLTACSSLTSSPQQTIQAGAPLGTHYMLWPQRQAQLTKIQQWDISGNLAINTNRKGTNASFNWQQQGNNYTLALFGPLGTNRIELTGQPGSVTMHTNQHTYSAATPEQLVASQLGVELPVSSLSYWIRGLPFPNDRRARQSYDMNKHIAQLRQHGWHVIYLRYVSIKGIDLPARILMESGNIEVRIVINKWSI